jgi:formylglycine-generating enzyme required for sulfatase activity
VEAGKCRTPANWSGETYAQEQASMPVTHVTWADALTYAQFAGKRLPTEVEWEYVACGGKKCLNYPWGDDWEANAANVSSGALAPAPVGSFAKDQTLGIFDIVGNVSEWVQYDNSAYGSQEPIRDCLNCKIYRGGNFKDKISDSPVTKRWEVTPDIPSDQADQILPKVGFRCAKNVPANMNLVPKKTRLYMLIISKASTSLDRLTSLYPSQSRRVNSDSIYHIHIDHLSTDNLTRQKIALKE